MTVAYSKHMARKHNARRRHACQAKRRYESFESAKQASRSIQAELGLKFPNKVYPCMVCSGYHLTTKR